MAYEPKDIDQARYTTGKTIPSNRKLEMDAPSRKGFWQGAYTKAETDWNHGAADLRNAASGKSNMYGGPGRGEPGSRSTKGQVARQAPAKPHVYNEDEDFGM